jgi:CubicO group peptidase (beta-lactamase class C family)
MSEARLAGHHRLGWRDHLAAVLVAVTGITILAGMGGVASAEATYTLQDFQAVDRYVQDQTNEARIPGLALGIVHGDQVAHIKGFGHADQGGRPVTPQTPFVIGSISKSFTALATMQLVEAGKLNLDTPVQRYLPEFRLAQTAASQHITVRQLLNQTSGIPSSAGINPLSQPVSSLESQVRSLAEVSASAAPGERYEYSNSNYEVLGRLVEVASGEPYDDYISRHVFAPLNMRHSHASAAEAKLDGLATPAPLWFGFPQPRLQGAGIRSDFVPAGYLISSAEDMTHYLVAQLNGGHYDGAALLSSTGVATLHRPVAPAGLSAVGGSYAMGWFVGSRDQLGTTIWHNGSAAGMHSMAVILPAQKWAVVVLTNTESLLYEFLSRMEVIADNVAAMLAQRPLAGTLTGLYTAFDVVAVLMLLLAARTLVRVLRRRRQPRRGRLKRVRTVLFDYLVPLWRELLVPVAILVGLPIALAAPWLKNLLTTDVGQWLFALALLLLATGAGRVAALIRARRPSPQAGQARVVARDHV